MVTAYFHLISHIPYHLPLPSLLHWYGFKLTYHSSHRLLLTHSSIADLWTLWLYFGFLMLIVFMHPSPIGGRVMMFYSHPSVNTYFMWHDISLLSGGISTKLATNIHHVSENCLKGFQGYRSEVKVVCVLMCECCDGGVIHFDGVASRYTCFYRAAVCRRSFLRQRCPSVFLSVCPSHAWIVTKRMKVPPSFLYHMKGKFM